jgi:hypothetical protein
MSERVFYVAHPVAGDVPANLARALRWLKWLSTTERETVHIAPWISAIMSGEDDSDPAARARGLRHDCLVVRRCDGIVLVGGRVSSGMAIERDAAHDAGLTVIDLTHLGDEPPARPVTDFLIRALRGES